MAAQSGRQFLLKIGDGGSPTIFSTVGGFQSRSIGSSATSVEVTNQDSVGNQELLDGAGTLAKSFSGNGVFVDDAALETMRANHESQTLTEFEVVVPGLGTYTGYFKITELEFSGDHDGEVSYSVSLSSHGAVAFVAS